MSSGEMVPGTNRSAPVAGAFLAGGGPSPKPPGAIIETWTRAVATIAPAGSTKDSPAATTRSAPSGLG